MVVAPARSCAIKIGFNADRKAVNAAIFDRHVKHGEGANDAASKPEIVSLVNSLQACAEKKDFYQGCRLHAAICDGGLLWKNKYLGNAVISMYAKCGALVRAQEILDGLPVRDAVSWSALIAGYTQHGLGEEAIGCFRRMQRDGLSPSAFTYSCMLKACGIVQDVGMGEEIHNKVVSQGLLKQNVVLGTALVDMYAKCGDFKKARHVFDQLPVRDVVSWSALIAGYVRLGNGPEALGCYWQMQSEGLCPDAITYACTLKACGITQNIELGKRIHDEIHFQGLLEKNVMLGTALVDMYVKCGVLVKAKVVLHELPVRNVASWSALIAGYAEYGHGNEALCCFHQMREEGFSPDAITYACILKACAIVKDIEMGKEIHEEIVHHGLLKKNSVLGIALVDMYAKCGMLPKAQEVLHALPVRTVPSWGALIAGYVHHGKNREALRCFLQMKREGLFPDVVTYACVLKSCGILQDCDVGKTIHDEIVRQGMLEENITLGTALVDMYAKCGAVMKAQDVLDDLPVRSVACWSALIAGYAQQGQCHKALDCFHRMRREKFSPNVVSWSALIGGYAQQGLAKEALDCFRWMEQEKTLPDALTFVGVLYACSHSGLVEEGQMYFDAMKDKYGIKPNKEHYTCMVDLFGRARLFDKATRVIKLMPSSDYVPVWFALLDACRKWGNVKLGIMAFDRVTRLDKSNAAAYVLMRNIFAAADMHEKAQEIESMRIRNTVSEYMGQSLYCE